VAPRRGGLKTHGQAAGLVIALLLAAGTAGTQELDFQKGITKQQGGSGERSSSYSLGYLETLGEHAAWSVTYVNEGHVPFHKRDGFAFQLWGREQLVGRRLSLAAGVGPYLYYDTHITASPTGTSYADEHGVGAIASVAATFYTGGRLFFQARGNWIATGRTTEIITATVGIGFQLEPSRMPEPPTEAGGQSTRAASNEVTVLAGRATLNSVERGDAFSQSVEYRHGLTRSLDWTLGWLDEGKLIARAGPMAQLWAVRAFFADRLALGIGFGPYLVRDRHGEDSTTRLDCLVSLTGRVRLMRRWALRGTFHRVTTSYSRDSDVFLIGVSYLF
jgi:hypothetical protein